jgi:hypothetical protein
MANWRHRRLLRQAWHPSDEELLLYVEGESDARGARRVSDHLSGCWTCRARREEIERAIGAYMAYDRDRARTGGAGGAGGANGADNPEQATRRFATALARAKERAQQDASYAAALLSNTAPGSRSELESETQSAAERERARPFSGRPWRMPGLRRVGETLARASEAKRKGRTDESDRGPQQWKRRRAEREHAEPPLAERSWRMPDVRGVAWTFVRVAALLLVVVFAARWWLAPAPVSARELMARVDRARQQEIAAVADPVIYQRLHASRTSTNVPRASSDDTVTWEVWSSQRQRRIVERVSASSPLLLDLQAVLRENGMEPGQPLSAASLTAWRRFAGHVAEEVRETKLSDGTAAVALTSSAPGPVGEGRIARSEVIVRTRDWHPVAHILTVAGAAGQQQRYTITELNYRIVPFETVDAAVFNPPAIARTVEADEATGDAPAAPAPAIHPARTALLALHEEHTTGACLQDRRFTEPDLAMRHLWAIRQLAEWYRTAQGDGLARGLDARSKGMLTVMVREHLEAARQHLPSSAEAIERNAASREPADERGGVANTPAPSTAGTGAAGTGAAAANTPTAGAPASGTVAGEKDAAADNEPWTTVAMKAYAAVEYVSRASALETARGAAVDGGSEARQDVSGQRDAVVRARALLRALDAAVQRLAPGAASGAADAPSGRGR